MVSSPARCWCGLVEKLPELARFERSHTSPSACIQPERALSSRRRPVQTPAAGTTGGSSVPPDIGVWSVPRHTHSRQSQRRSTPTFERGGGGGGKRSRLPSGEIDAQALALRESGKSFSAIARTLELERATDAHTSFVRALGTSQDSERHQLIKNEEARLDQLEHRIRQRDAADLPKLERRLLALQKFREAIRR
jgi:hypothetical protein